MKNLNDNLFRFAGLLLALLSSLTFIATIGCSNYKHFTFRESPYHFSFEYPATYYIERAFIEPTTPHVLDRVIINMGPVGKPAPGGFEFVIYLDPSSGNATSAMDGKLRFISQLPDPKVLERTYVKVAGTLGEKVEYTTLPPSNPLFRIFRQAFFVHGDRLWSVTMISDNITAEKDKAAFEHMLKTLGIYD
ncbi:MAG: hypothetical protein ABIH70_00050 [Chloroflexota bacterium]